MDKLKEQYQTKDLYIAALFYACGVKLEDVKREGGVCWFVFDDRDKCERIQKNYWGRVEVVNAKKFVEAIRTLKNIVFINN